MKSIIIWKGGRALKLNNEFQCAGGRAHVMTSSTFVASFEKIEAAEESSDVVRAFELDAATTIPGGRAGR